jgi:PBSX family phage portal protein
MSEELSPREELRAFIVSKATESAMGSMQTDESAVYSDSFLRSQKLLKPRYDPENCYLIHDDNPTLPQCINAMVTNVDGFGFEMKYVGPPDAEGAKAVIAEKKLAEDFFKKVNEKESFRTVRKSMRKDYEITGNGYIEVIRNLKNEPYLIYWMDAKRVRLTPRSESPYTVRISFSRGGKDITAEIQRSFRKFAMKSGKTNKSIRWFKEYGDPRKMNPETGKFEAEDGYTKSKLGEASEVLHFKQGNDAYGVPRWAGMLLVVLGLRASDYVNWDLFENQVIPPLAVLVSGGTLTKETVKDLMEIFKSKKGLANFNKILILEAMASEGNIDSKDGAKVDFKEMSARKEDALFTEYTERGEHRVRTAFRLAPLYVGRADEYSKSTSDSSRMVTEEQVFVPERMDFDETVNRLILPEIGVKNWAYASLGPRLISGEDQVMGFREFWKGGAFTINEAIRLANQVLGMDITVYKDKWADLPFALVLEAAKSGLFSGLGEFQIGNGPLTAIEQMINNPEDMSEEEATKAYAGINQIKTLMDSIANKRSYEEFKEGEETKLFSS